jgi:hypothetical protein
LLLDPAGDPYLAPEAWPVENERRDRVRCELPTFLTLVIGEEAEAAFVDAPE